MTDKQICEKVAELWIELGGDYDGFKWCSSLVLSQIHEKLKENKNGS